MSGKKFKLDQVLKYRVEIERMRSQEFAVAKQHFENATDLLVMKETQMEYTKSEFVSRHDKFENIDELRMYANFLTRTNEEIINQKEQVVILGNQLNYRREILHDATKEKKVLEMLKEKKANQFRQEANLKEQTFMDEISVQKKTGNPR